MAVPASVVKPVIPATQTASDGIGQHLLLPCGLNHACWGGRARRSRAPAEHRDPDRRIGGWWREPSRENHDARKGEALTLAQQIRDVLNRRTDLSTFVVHLTRDRSPSLSARLALDSIIRERKLFAGAPMGWAKEQDDPSDPQRQTQRVVCFSETPLEHIYSLVADIEGRQVRLAPYGLAFTKIAARRMGINPIWYVDMSPGKDWVLARAIERLRKEAIATGSFHEQPIARLTPFFEQMGTWPNSRKEFWWEREWRHVGDLPLPREGILWLCPEDEMDSLPDTATPAIDPRWGLEQIVAHLAGFRPEDITPFLPHQEPSEEDWIAEYGETTG